MLKRNLFLTVTFIIVFTIVGCVPNTIEEFLRKEGKDYNQILYIEQMYVGSIVFYDYIHSDGQKGIGIALVKGNQKQGWESISSMGVGIRGEDLEWDIFRAGDKEFLLIYGIIQNPNIEKVQLKEIGDNQSVNQSFEDATKINTKGYRLWFKQVSYDLKNIEIMGLSSQGYVQYTYPPSK